MTARRRAGACALALALALLTAVAVPAGATLTPVAGPPAFEALGSVRQAAVLGAPAGATVELRDAADDVVATGTTDSLGGELFREVDAGDGYTLTVSHGGETSTSPPFTVLGDPLLDPGAAHPDQSFYDSLPPLPVDGYGYTAMRDGITLGVQTSLPGPAANGPYPTVVEYSGYDPSNPGNGSNIFKLIANALGYAYVGVNIRGSGCSGGAFDFFENVQSLDGYDVIETVAAQPWAGNIGMVGISYPGISQLYVAQTQPPHLTAITPLSVLDDVFRGTLYPGGIFNDGFALSWATDRVNSNRWPGGAGWVTERVGGGDTTCAANTRLRGQNTDLLAQIEANPFFPAPGNPSYPLGAELFTPYAFVDQIEVPTYLSGAWQDEQTGGHFPYLLENLTRRPGRHAEGQPLQRHPRRLPRARPHRPHRRVPRLLRRRAHPLDPAARPPRRPVALRGGHGRRRAPAAARPLHQLHRLRRRPRRLRGRGPHPGVVGERCPPG